MNKYKEMKDRQITRQRNEINEAINADETGDGFIFDMFCYELEINNCIIKGSIRSAFDALCFTLDEVIENPKLYNSLRKAVQVIKEKY